MSVRDTTPNYYFSTSRRVRGARSAPPVASSPQLQPETSRTNYVILQGTYVVLDVSVPCVPVYGMTVARRRSVTTCHIIRHAHTVHAYPLCVFLMAEIALWIRPA
jgi:hypothetical protein